MPSTQVRVERIVSGGQTGADRGGLEAAIKLDIPHGGWCPAGRIAEDGRIPARYQLVETMGSDYSERTWLNVRDSSGTIVFVDSMTPGSRATVEFCVKARRPYLIVPTTVSAPKRAVGRIRLWLDQMGEMPRLNIAGTRESKAPGIQLAVTEILLAVLRPEPKRKP